VAALAGALFFGISAVADQLSTKKIQQHQALSPKIFVDLVRQPLWLAAIGTNIIGFVLQIVALSFGSLAIVQPLLVFDLVFAVVIARQLRQRSHTPGPGGKGGDLVLFGGAAAVSVGVAGFLVIGQPTDGVTHASLSTLPPLAIALVVVIGGCLVVANKKQSLRPLALALGCGVCYGVAAFTIKLVTAQVGHGPAVLFGNWPIYILLICGPLGFLLNQNAFQQGTFLAPVQAIITAADPVVSILLGILWLKVTVRSTPAAIAGEVVTLLIMVGGIVVTAEHAPNVAGCGVPPPGTMKPATQQPAADPDGAVQQPASNADSGVTRNRDRALISSPSRVAKD
jgi:hypothetical protein